VYVATGLNFPDALAAAAAAGHLDAPILLVLPTGIPTPTKTELTRLKPVKIIVAGGTGVVSNTVLNQLAAYTVPAGTVERQSGPDRYATAANVSLHTFDPGVPVVYIATGSNFPDALAAAAAAGRLGGPVLLVTRTSIPTATATELNRLGPGRIIVAGGTGVVSNTVLTQLTAFTSGGVERQSGANRYSTAASVSSHTFAPGVPVVYVATGLNFPDALAAAAAAGRLGGPVLLVGPTSIPTDTQAELSRLKPGRIVVAGGSGVVSDAVLNQLATYLAP
jgi:putative cell wall-binding protein